MTAAWEALATGWCQHADDGGAPAWQREDEGDDDWVTWRCPLCGARAVTLAGG